ncbi:uncharacterized protein LOC111047115 [Nilaparvata lugens]|uniref:uncharacterized protein LOC111047115 n=1 Tax=Nilaparvata lugens TaxID=108931 RepID=UPI00193E5262|nr:uncharacterized protein LOC111047115 [Nilaparvata lugens]
MSNTKFQEIHSTGFENSEGFINVDVGDKVFLRGRELNKSQQEAYQFLKEKRVEEIFNFLIEHLLVNTPRDPLNFLVDLLDKCINFRDDLKDPPLLFDRSHQEIIYKAFDPGNKGFVTQQQFCTALKTVGLGESSLLPSMSKNNIIFKNEFLIELDSALINNLYSMMGGEREDMNISTAVRGSLQYKGRHRGSDSTSLLLENGSKKSSVHFFLAMNEGSDGFESPARISHSEFFEHISRKSPGQLSSDQGTSSLSSKEQDLNIADRGLESAIDSNHDETEYYVNEQFMHNKSLEEIVSLENLPLTENNESIGSFPVESVKTSAGGILSDSLNLEENRKLSSCSRDSKIESNEKRSSSLKNLEVQKNDNSSSSFQYTGEDNSKSGDNINDSM